MSMCACVCLGCPSWKVCIEVRKISQHTGVYLPVTRSVDSSADPASPFFCISSEKPDTSHLLPVHSRGGRSYPKVPMDGLSPCASNSMVQHQVGLFSSVSADDICAVSMQTSQRWPWEFLGCSWIPVCNVDKPGEFFIVNFLLCLIQFFIALQNLLFLWLGVPEGDKDHSWLLKTAICVKVFTWALQVPPKHGRGRYVVSRMRDHIACGRCLCLRLLGDCGGWSDDFVSKLVHFLILLHDSPGGSIELGPIGSCLQLQNAFLPPWILWAGGTQGAVVWKASFHPTLAATFGGVQRAPVFLTCLIVGVANCVLFHWAQPNFCLNGLPPLLKRALVMPSRPCWWVAKGAKAVMSRSILLFLSVRTVWWRNIAQGMCCLGWSCWFPGSRLDGDVGRWGGRADTRLNMPGDL